MHRRDFVESCLRGVGATLVPSFAEDAFARLGQAAAAQREKSPLETASDEAYWREVKSAFTTSRSMIDLDNGNVSPSPRVVTESMMRYKWMEQENPAYQIYEVLIPSAVNIIKGLAQFFGCAVEEVAIMRNATEALHNVLLGVPLEAGDEILTTTHDYWAMQQALDQRAAREGVVIKRASVPVPAASMNELVSIFERAVTSRTRLILLSHPVNLTGQFFPVRQICEMAHARGVEVCVDGAQSFAQIEMKVNDLQCDYFGTSLHKWLMAPIGTGMLYVKREKIGKVWPLLPSNPKEREQIWKFMDHGTQSLAPHLAITDALAFHEAIGSARKEARLRYLTQHWARRLRTLDNVRLLSDVEKPEMSCALASFTLEGLSPEGLVRFLQRRHAITVQHISSSYAPEVNAVRVTPSLYTTLQELDAFCDVVADVAKHGLPKDA